MPSFVFSRGSSAGLPPPKTRVTNKTVLTHMPIPVPCFNSFSEEGKLDFIFPSLEDCWVTDENFSYECSRNNKDSDNSKDSLFDKNLNGPNYYQDDALTMSSYHMPSLSLGGPMMDYEENYHVQKMSLPPCKLPMRKGDVQLVKNKSMRSVTPKKNLSHVSLGSRVDMSDMDSFGSETIDLTSFLNRLQLYKNELPNLAADIKTLIDIHFRNRTQTVDRLSEQKGRTTSQPSFIVVTDPGHIDWARFTKAANEILGDKEDLKATLNALVPPKSMQDRMLSSDADCEHFPLQEAFLHVLGPEQHPQTSTLFGTYRKTNIPTPKNKRENGKSNVSSRRKDNKNILKPKPGNDLLARTPLPKKSKVVAAKNNTQDAVLANQKNAVGPKSLKRKRPNQDNGSAKKRVNGNMGKSVKKVTKGGATTVAPKSRNSELKEIEKMSISALENLITTLEKKTKLVKHKHRKGTACPRCKIDQRLHKAIKIRLKTKTPEFIKGKKYLALLKTSDKKTSKPNEPEIGAQTVHKHTTKVSKSQKNKGVTNSVLSGNLIKKTSGLGPHHTLTGKNGNIVKETKKGVSAVNFKTPVASVSSLGHVKKTAQKQLNRTGVKEVGPSKVSSSKAIHVDTGSKLFDKISNGGKVKSNQSGLLSPTGKGTINKNVTRNLVNNISPKMGSPYRSNLTSPKLDIGKPAVSNGVKSTGFNPINVQKKATSTRPPLSFGSKSL